jgi:hypothetical protein
MRLLLLIFLCACHFERARPLVSAVAVEELESSAAEDLRCPESKIESRPLTLLTRVVEGCGHQRVYAFDPLRAVWVIASVEKR